MIVVCDTSPITNLDAIGQLDLLRQLYGTVVIPEAVFFELTVDPANPGASAVQTLHWIETKPVLNQTLVTALRTSLDEGESEAIALAIEMKATLLLMDERLGRTTAAQLGLQVIGLLGVLLEAKHRGFISAIKPLLDDLTNHAGFWISPQLYSYVLQSAGE